MNQPTSSDQPLQTRATRKRLRRISDSQAISMALLDQPGPDQDGPIDPIIHTGPHGPCLVNRATGEILEAEPGEGLALRCAVQHLLHGDPANHWTGTIQAKRGVRYLDRRGQPTTLALSGALHTHSSRLCGDHMEGMRLRNRRTARAAIALAESRLSEDERLAQAKGWDWRAMWVFLTLTLPRVQGATSLSEIQRINRAWGLFRKRDAFKLHVLGGIKAIEDKLTVRGPHVHIHSLALSRRWDWLDIRQEWAECVATATAEIYDIHLNPSDLVQGGAVIDIRTVRPKVQDPTQQITLEDAISECLKYVTKPADLTTLDGATLLELELVQRWGRMFEIYGCCRADHDDMLAKLERNLIKVRHELSQLRAQHRDARAAIQASQADLRLQVANLKADIAHIQSYQRDPAVDPKAIRSAVASLRQDQARLRKDAQELRNNLGALRTRQAQEQAPKIAALARAEKAIKAYRETWGLSSAAGGAFVHTTRISDGGFSKPTTKPPKPPSWRQLMYELPLGEWLKVILRRIKASRRHMGRILTETFDGTLTTVEGQSLIYG